MNKQEMPTVSVGIPAYNEELNVGKLVKRILEQNNSNHALKEIIVVSDSSSDNTVAEVRKIKDPRVKVVDRKTRLGLNRTQNEIVSLTTGDILVLLDADTLPIGEDFLNNIVKPIIHDKNVGIVGGDVVSVKPNSFFEKVISDSHEFKYSLYKRINHGNNIYVCHGRVGAFSRALYSQLKWPIYPAEDAYAYLFCKEKGFEFVFEPSAKVLFRSPATLQDHIKQSQRFFGERRDMKKYFEPEFVKRHYHIPNTLMAKSIISGLVRNPFTIFMYLVIAVYIRLFLTKKFTEKSSWEPSVTTKKIL